MNRISVTPEIYHWVSDRSGLTVDALEKKFPKIRNWINDKSRPTFKQVEELAKKTHTPLGYFFLHEPVEEHLPIPYFRTINDDLPRHFSTELLDSIYSMQQRQEWVREFLINQGETRLPFVGSAIQTDNYKDIANNIRKTLGLDNHWASKYVTWTKALEGFCSHIEQAEILLVINGVVGNNTHRKLDTTEFRGFVLYDEYAPLIFVNGADYKSAQMFTLAHEIAHVWFGSSAAFDLRNLQPSTNAMEQACNRVAAELLVPEDELSDIWKSVKNTDNAYQIIARHFKVSPIVAARRVLDLNFISKDDFFNFYEKYMDDENRKKVKNSKGGGDFWATQNFRIGRRFGNMVVSASKAGKLLYSEAYKLTGLPAKTYNEYVDRVTGEL